MPANTVCLLKNFGFLVCLAALPVSASVNVKNEIEWLSSDFPPCHYHDGVNQGYCDEIGEAIFAKIEGYRFQKNISSLARYKALMQTDREFCTLELLYSQQRAQYLHFSEPLYPVLAMGIVTKKDSLVSKQLLAIEPQQRMTLVVSENVRVGVANSRFYGKFIDGYLTDMDKDVYQVNEYKTLIELLKAEKIDVTFFNPAELPIYDAGNQLSFFEVGTEPLILTYLSCSKSESGLSVINQVNQLLKTEMFSRLYEPYERRLREKEKRIYQRHLSSQCKRYNVVSPCPYE